MNASYLLKINFLDVCYLSSHNKKSSVHRIVIKYVLRYTIVHCTLEKLPRKSSKQKGRHWQNLLLWPMWDGIQYLQCVLVTNPIRHYKTDS